MDTAAHLAALRREYAREGLRRRDLADDPSAQFRRWFDEAVAAKLVEPNAMVLSTADGSRPSSRTVLLKAFDERGFVFYTNYESRKARDIAADPHVSLLFPWYPLERQVCILERLSASAPRSLWPILPPVPTAAGSVHGFRSKAPSSPPENCSK